MTVAIEDIKAGPYEGDGVKTDFDFDFKTLVDTDVAVYYLDVDEVQTLLVKDTDYTITLNADQNDNAGGKITKLGTVLPAGEFLTLVNEPDFLQQVKIRTESFVKPSVMETMLDRVTLLAQRAKLDTARALKMPLSWDGVPLDLPFPKADNILMWNDTLDGFRNVAATAVNLLDRLQDADNDTKIWVEKNPDEDIIRFDVAGAERGDWTPTRLRVQDVLEIHSADNTLSALHFGDPEDADVGRITYDHNGNVMRVWLAAGIKGRWDATGLSIGGNDVAPDGPLHIGAGLAGAATARTDGDDIIIEAADNAGLTLLGGTASRIWFGDAANGNNKGLIECRPGTPSLGFGLNASASMFEIRTNEIILNGSGADQNIRMEGTTNANLFFLDAGTERLSLGGDGTADGPLHIGAGLAGAVTAQANADNFIIESGGADMGMNFLGSATSTQHIFFGDTGNPGEGQINYNHSSRTMGFYVAVSKKMVIFPTGVVVNESQNGAVFAAKGDSVSNLFRVVPASDGVVIGSATPDASALLDLVSTTKGLGLTTWTTTQRDAITTPRDGLIGHNSITNTVDARLNGAWVGLTSDVSLGLVLLATATAANDATIDFTSNIDSTYEEYVLVGRGVVPATNDVELWLRVFVGGVIQSGGSDYSYGGYAAQSSAGVVNESALDSNIPIAVRSAAGDSVNNGAGEGCDFELKVFNPASTSLDTRARGWSGWVDDADLEWCRDFSGRLQGNTSAVDGLRVLFESGNITSGEFALYGVKTS